MWVYIVKRILLIIPTLFGISVISFLMINLAPGDPISLSAGSVEQGFTKEQMRGAQTEQFAKDPFSILKRYGAWISRLVNVKFGEIEAPPADAWVYLKGHFVVYEAFELRAGPVQVNLLDFQRSLKDRRPVLQTLLSAVKISIILNIIAMAITYFVSIPLGIFSAVNRDTIKDRVVTVLLFILYSLPSFWLAYMLILYVGKGSGKLELLPIVGLNSDGAEVWWQNGEYWTYAKDRMQHYVLPIICLTLASFAYLSRLVRAGMLEVLRQDYITTARAKGLPESLVIGKHALRNSLIPIITLMAGLLPQLLGGSIIIEQIFTINGMGRLSFTSVLARDYTTLMAVFTVSAILVLFGILLSDLAYTFVDPRVSFEKQVG